MNDSFLSTQNDTSLAAIRQLVADRSAPASPMRLTLLLVATAGGGVFLALVWVTEPEPLPPPWVLDSA